MGSTHVYTPREACSLLEEAERRRGAFQRAVLEWARRNLRDFPWRKDRTPYKVLVAEVILRRTTSKAASRVYGEFLKNWPDIKSLSRAGVSELEGVLKAVGYHKRRARILVDIAKYIEENYGGEIPRGREALLRIPHVGPYVAGAVLSLGYGIPAAMVDSNVSRILSRCFKDSLPKRGLARALQMLAEALIPEEEHATYNLGLLDLGALVCRYDRPRCSICLLRATCDTGGSTSGK